MAYKACGYSTLTQVLPPSEGLKDCSDFLFHKMNYLCRTNLKSKEI